MKANITILLPALLQPVRASRTLVNGSNHHTLLGHAQPAPGVHKLHSKTTHGTSTINPSTSVPFGSLYTLTWLTSSTPSDGLFITETLSGIGSYEASISTSITSPAITITATVVARPAVGVSESATSHVLSTASPSPSTIARLETCFSTPSGIDTNGNVNSGCGGIISHVQSCLQTEQSWTDPSNTATNEDFQSCVCRASATGYFHENDPIYHNATTCASCLLFTGAANSEELQRALGQLNSFSRSQNPSAYLFLQDYYLWFSTLPTEATNANNSPSALQLAPVYAALQAMKPHFTTIPPLANLAYGAHAPSRGAFADLTPVLTT